VVSVVGAACAAFAAVWARSAVRAVDDFAGIVLPYLSKSSPVGAVVAAAAAAPEPTIVQRATTEPPVAPVEPAVPVAPAVPPVEPTEPPVAPVPRSRPLPPPVPHPAPPDPAEPAEPPVGAPLPMIVTVDDDEPRESAPLVEPNEHSPTVPMAAPRSRAEPPETGPSRSGERAREDRDERAAGYFTAYVVPTEPPRSDLPPSSMMQEALGVSDAAAERRRRAHELGQATERQRQLDARKKREAEQVARQVGLLSDEEAARPSGEGFAMDRPSWEGRTAVHDQASVQAALDAATTVVRPPLVARPPVAPSRAAPPVAAPHPALASPPAPLPPSKPRAKADSSPTLLSEGVIEGPRQRHDARAEPVSRVDVHSR
jgi:hypothetical protein